MMGWLRRRRSTPSFPPQPTAERDWVAGDLAKCIAPSGTWKAVNVHLSDAPSPRAGEILRVSGVHSGHGVVWLSFRGLAPYCFPAGHFRKLRRCSTEFGEELRGRKPLSVPRALPELVE